MFTFRTKLSMAKAVVTKRSPFYVQFYVSNACHLRCKMCNIVQANADTTPFPHEKIEAIADNLVKIGVGVVLLTGGEPFLRKDIADIVRVFKSRNLDVRLQTAGLVQRWDTIAQCAEFGARDINVSLDSLDEQLADRINGVDGSWRDALRTISFISRTFPGKGSICALGCVMSAYNLDEIEAVLDFATEIGWWLSLVPVHITTSDKPLNFRGCNEDFRIGEGSFEKLGQLIERLKQRKKQGALLFDSDDYLDSSYDFVRTGQPVWRKRGICDSPYLYFAILPDGRFAPCCDWRLDQDVHVYDADFPRIYKTRKLRAQVREVVSQCPGCNFGSFPEMTLSVRSLPTLVQRVMLQFTAHKRRLQPVAEDQLFEIVEKIKSRYPIYQQKRIMPENGEEDSQE
jgi:MoaA/NifB/PqqE/SkfB family radical SAM enzyme